MSHFFVSNKRISIWKKIFLAGQPWYERGGNDGTSFNSGFGSSGQQYGRSGGGSNGGYQEISGGWSDGTSSASGGRQAGEDQMKRLSAHRRSIVGINCSSLARQVHVGRGHQRSAQGAQQYHGRGRERADRRDRCCLVSGYECWSIPRPDERVRGRRVGRSEGGGASARIDSWRTRIVRERIAVVIGKWHRRANLIEVGPVQERHESDAIRSH